MKLTTSKEQRDFFQKNGWIEFEEILTEEQLTLMRESIRQVLAKRLRPSSYQFVPSSPENVYAQGHDLWRENSKLQQCISRTKFTEVVVELGGKKPLRLGYDQFFPEQRAISQTKLYPPFLQQSASLQQISCISNLCCGLMIALTSSAQSEGETTSADIFPHQQGRVVFINPLLPIPWNALLTYHSNQQLYMVVYTLSLSHYTLQPEDPHTHQLKRLGYIFNDKLRDSIHPIVLR